MGTAPVTERVLVRSTWVGAAVAVATGVVASTGRVSALERSVGRAGYDLPTWSTDLWRAVMQVGTRGAIVVVAVALVVAGRRRTAAVAAASGLVAWGICSLGKGVIGRDRPTALTLGRPMRDVVERAGYPSSHTAIAAALCTAVAVSLPLAWGWRALLVAVALATAVARVHVTAHWPLDVVGGGAVGVTVAGAAALVAGRRR